MEIKHKNIDIQNLAKAVSLLIEQGKNSVAHAVNSTLTILYWQVGSHIHHELLQSDRARYGKQVVELLAAN
jgi:hypothetical protein